MKFQFASDLHLEFIDNESYLENNPMIPSAPILILAGDIDLITKGQVQSPLFEYFSKNWEQTYIIPGNHEYYAKENVENALNFELKVFNNVNYLNNRSLEINGVEFYFTTLWSECKSTLISKYIGDFHYCRWGRNRYTLDHHNQLHQAAVTWLNNELIKPKKKPRVVVSHFVPSSKVDKYPVGTDTAFSAIMKEYFVAQLDDYLEKWDVDYWLYGHSHWNNDCEIFKIKFRSNMLGYVSQKEHLSFQHDRIIEIKTHSKYLSKL